MVVCCKESSLSLTESVAAVIEVVSPSLSVLTASSSLSELTASSSLSELTASSSLSVLTASSSLSQLTASSSLSQVWELTANNVIMVSAIGNDGPLYG